MPTTDEMNAMALAQNLTDLRDEIGPRLEALEANIARLDSLLTQQTRVLQETLARLMGAGATAG